MILISYLIGSFPTAIIAGRLLIKDDIRKHGSGNAGATNVFRVLGWKPALVVVLIDIAKGFIPVFFIAKAVTAGVPLGTTVIMIIAGVSAIAGHVWTVFAGFRGGKGVGTGFGVLLGLAPVPALITLGVWIIITLLTKIVSVASISAALTFPLVLFVQRMLGRPVPLALHILSGVLALFILVTHRKNIGRLIRGEEKKISRPGSAAVD
jgi:glycerol-3-phosphate acyltransferase PlsY